MNPLSALVSLPGEVLGVLGAVGRLSDRLDEVAAATAVLPRMLESIGRVADDTRGIPELAANVAVVAEATKPIAAVARDTSTLPDLDRRMATIEAAMPTLLVGVAGCHGSPTRLPSDRSRSLSVM